MLKRAAAGAAARAALAPCAGGSLPGTPVRPGETDLVAPSSGSAGTRSAALSASSPGSVGDLGDGRSSPSLGAGEVESEDEGDAYALSTFVALVCDGGGGGGGGCGGGSSEEGLAPPGTPLPPPPPLEGYDDAPPPTPEPAPEPSPSLSPPLSVGSFVADALVQAWQIGRAVQRRGLRPVVAELLWQLVPMVAV